MKLTATPPQPLFQPLVPEKRVTATDIRRAITARFPQKEYAVMFEVANSTGSNISRYADAVVMSLWPSRGLELTGIEIKVSHSDYLRESKDPSKAEEIAKFCDRWVLYVAPNVVKDLGAVPPAWGVEEFDGKAFRTLKKSKITESLPMTRGFVASMLRGSDNTAHKMIAEIERNARDAADLAVKDARDAIDARVNAEVERRTKSATNLENNFQRVKDLSGVDLRHNADNWELLKFFDAVATVKKLRAAGFDSPHYGMMSAIENIQKSVDQCRVAILEAQGDNPQNARHEVAA
jgi:hypothetical protein